MSDLVRVDAWLHNVFHYKLSLDVCEKRFEEFSLEGNRFILQEIKNRMIPSAEKNGYLEMVESYKKIITLLEKCIEEKIGTRNPT